jgi:hypothetical protein
MTYMSQFRKFQRPVWPLMLALVCAVSCSRQIDVPTEGSPQADQTPFREKGASDGGSDAIGSVAGLSQAYGNGLPFRNSQYVPAGTLLTVRLKSSITAGSITTENSFQAVVEEPVVVEGNTMIPQGAVVAGRIESSRISKVKPDRGYVRLALESVHVGGLDVPVQTASLFAPQAPQDEETIRLEKGRRLTFRLMQAVSLNGQRAQLNH